MKGKILLLAFLCAQSMAFAFSSFAADGQAFDRIFSLKMAELTQESADLLEKRYPDEDWDGYRFPKFVFTSEAVETGYRIAVKEPELLKPIPCYCFCDEMGHRNLLHCFLKGGKLGGKYDDHAVTCNICYGQAMLAFLWKHKAGAGDAEILDGMEKKFERLVKERGKNPHGGH